MSLKITNLTHTYSSKGIMNRTVLDIPDWQVLQGQQVLLRGVSGSGKTTLFNIIAGLLSPTSGDVTFDHQSIYALPEARRDRFRIQHIGYIFQTHFLLSSLTAIENVVMPMAFADYKNNNKRRSYAFHLLEQLGLADFTKHYPKQLSNGQRMRVSVARALANTPQLLLADEPTASLDEAASNEVMDLIQQICSENHATLIVASHDPLISDRFEQTIHLHEGQILEGELQR